MWRTSALLCLFNPFNLYNHWNTPIVQWVKDNVTPYLLRHSVQVILVYFFITVSFAQALERTSVGPVYLFSGCTSLILVLLRFFGGEKVASFTMLSVVLAMSGVAVCMKGGGAAARSESISPVGTPFCM